MKRYSVVITILTLIAVLTVSCTGAPSPEALPATPAGEEVNFRLLISDEANEINNFSSLNVTITQIGLKEQGGSENWTFYNITAPEPVDLTQLQGDNATAIWVGAVPTGNFTKVFIYADNVTGVLNSDNVTVKLPSDKLQISKPFTISEDFIVDFVFDITVIKAGESGKYILKPQITQSGPEQDFVEVTSSKGKPEEPGKPDNPGNSEKGGKPDNPGKLEDELQLQLEGDTGLSMSVTLIVTDDGSPVEGATITVNGEVQGTTDADGNLIIVLPDTPGEVTIEAILEDKNGELEIELE